VDKTLHMSIAFGRVSSQQFWEAIREQLQVRNLCGKLCAVVTCTHHVRDICVVLLMNSQHVFLRNAGCS
jgi:hypothetical protein